MFEEILYDILVEEKQSPATHDLCGLSIKLQMQSSKLQRLPRNLDASLTHFACEQNREHTSIKSVKSTIINH